MQMVKNGSNWVNTGQHWFKLVKTGQNGSKQIKMGQSDEGTKGGGGYKFTIARETGRQKMTLKTNYLARGCT